MPLASRLICRSFVTSPPATKIATPIFQIRSRLIHFTLTARDGVMLVSTQGAGAGPGAAAMPRPDKVSLDADPIDKRAVSGRGEPVGVKVKKREQKVAGLSVAASLQVLETRAKSPASVPVIV